MQSCSGGWSRLHGQGGRDRLVPVLGLWGWGGREVSCCSKTWPPSREQQTLSASISGYSAPESVLEIKIRAPKTTAAPLPIDGAFMAGQTLTGGTDAEAEAPILWPPDAKSRLIGKDPDAGKD